MKINQYIKTLPTLIWLALLCFFTYLMVLITLQYIPIKDDAAFLITKFDVIHLWYYKFSFFTHVYTSIFVLIFGIFQFPKFFRNSFPKLHRYLGMANIVLILFFAAPSGFVMGYYGNGGFYSQLSFCLLSVLWFYFTLQAYLKIKQHKIIPHRNYMMLSYALTLSAISLRLFKMILAKTLELPPMDMYKIVSWVGWVFNLVVALGWIYFSKKN